MDASTRVEQQLVIHLANVHNLVTFTCEEYFLKLRRKVYVTPKSYLSFIQSYKLVYCTQLQNISMQVP